MTRTAWTRRERRLLIALLAMLAVPVPLVSHAQTSGSPPGSQQQPPSNGEPMAQHPFAGMWVTEDGRVRH